MSYSELSSYINDLKQSGFDTMRLRVQLNRKLAYPLMTLVIAILAIPFSLYRRQTRRHRRPGHRHRRCHLLLGHRRHL